MHSIFTTGLGCSVSHCRHPRALAILITILLLVSCDSSVADNPTNKLSPDRVTYSEDSPPQASKGVASQALPFHEGQPKLEGRVQELPLPKFTDLIKELSKSVVNISVEGDLDDEVLDARQLPFLKRDPDRPLVSLGSGFIVSADGVILTNNHVIDRAKRVVVRLPDDRHEYEAKILGRDAKSDLAILQIEPKHELKFAYFGDSDAVEVGEWVIAIGNQFQLGQSVTAGIVSAKARKVPSRESGPYDSFIQTDASINPGSSGGPLFNTKGQVIGINTAIFSPGRAQGGSTGFNIGIGFAIPINLVKGVVPQLMSKGKVTRGMLGVIIQPVDRDVAQALNLETPSGALVAEVVPNSPAAKAGFKVEDVIIKFDGNEIGDHDDLPLMVSTTPIGRTAPVVVLRAGKEVTLRATIEELHEPDPKSVEDKSEPDSIGLITRELTAEEAQAAGLPDYSGAVIIESVQAGSIANLSGFGKEDIIAQIGGKKITSRTELAATLAALPTGKPVLVLVRRKDGTRFLVLKLAAIEEKEKDKRE